MTMDQAIWKGIHHTCFHIAEQAPIYKGQMKETFGYVETTIAAKQVLAGTYDYPSDFDQATKELCESCTRIWLGILENPVNITIFHVR